MTSSRPPRLRVRWIALAMSFAFWNCADSTGEPASTADGAEVSLIPPAQTDLTALDPRVASNVEDALRVIRSAPNDPELRFELGKVYDANSLFEAAQEAYAQAATLEPKHARAHYHRARMLRELGRLEESRAALECAIELAPEYAPAQRRSGDWHLQAGEFDAAERAFQRVRELDPAGVDGTLGMAHVALLRDEAERAEALAREVIATRPENTHAHHLLGSALRDQGRLEEAAAAFTLAARGERVEADPWVAEIATARDGYALLMEEAKACIGRGEFEESLQRLTRLHAEHPDDITVQGMMNLAWTKLKRYDEALTMLLAARERQPEHFRIELNLGILRMQQEKFELALQHVQCALELNPTHSTVYTVQAQILEELGETAGSLAAYQKALEFSSDPRALQHRIGWKQVALKRWDDAAKSFARLAQESPDDASVHATLAGCLAEVGDYDGALKVIARARAIDPLLKNLASIEARVAELKSGKQP